MDKPICFSQYFMNRQCIRSSFISKMLKCKPNTTLGQIILEDKNLATGLPQPFLMTLFELRRNIKLKTKQDFKNYFNKSKLDKKLLPLEKTYIFDCCWKAFINIIPKRFCGNNHNMKILKKLVKTVIYSMKGEHIMLCNFLENWHYDVGVWDGFSSETSKNVLNNILVWIVKNILSPIICLNFYVTTCKVDNDELKLVYFWKSEWQRFYDINLHKMIKSNILKKQVPLCYGRKIKRRLSKQKKIQTKSIGKNIPRLVLILKQNYDSRPIVRYKNENKNVAEKRRFKEKLQYLKLLSGEKPVRFDKEYQNVYKLWLSSGKPKLYFVKADLTNAFGCVDIEITMKILYERHLKLQNSCSDQIKIKYAQLYKEIIFELKRPLYVRAGSTVYEWKRGLVQGYKYSPALSEIYYSYMDEIYLSKLLAEFNNIDLYKRVVDDYLYITDDLVQAQNFIEALQNYKNLNLNKTVTNFMHPQIKNSDEITFLGYTYNTHNMEVHRAKNVFSGPMCYKIAFTNAICNIYKFLENRIGQSGIKIDRHLFNLHYNSEKLIWTHVFTTLCISAGKFCTILSILCKKQNINQYLTLYKKKVAVKLANKIENTISNNKPEDYLFVYCINHFRYLAWKALLLCAKNTVGCDNLVPQVTIELTKCCCIYGKWREHASRIDLEGNMKVAAVKDICTRTDLRKLFKEFDNTSKVLQFYDNRSRSLLF